MALTESRQQEYFSFLSDKGANRKFKQRGFAENFEAKLTWQSGSVIPKKLDEGIDNTKPEAVRYIPQNYFEQLTNEIEVEEFRKEIEDVVFSHVEETERMGKSTFLELQAFKTQQSIQETSELKLKLRNLNIAILECEEMADPKYRLSLEEDLKLKNIELDSLEKAKPLEVKEPDEQDKAQNMLSSRLTKIIESRSEVEYLGKKTTEIISQKKNSLQRLSSLLQNVTAIKSQVLGHKKELDPICKALGLSVELILKVDVDTATIDSALQIVKSEISDLEAESKVELKEDFAFNSLVTLPDLRSAYQFLSSTIEELKQQLGTPQRKHQAYLEKLEKWKKQKSEALGGDVDPKFGSRQFLEQKLAYIDKEVCKKLNMLLAERRNVVQKIFDSKKHVLEFYTEVRKSVETKLRDLKTDEFSVDIDASFVLDRLFPLEFLNHIDKTRRGVFHGSNNPDKSLELLTNEVNWNDVESIHTFHESIIKQLSTYLEKPNSKKDQIRNIKDFYDYLFSLDYISAKYELRLAGKNLNELSPGEKGLLLLVFYLQLDRDNTPLVIDQPEDNLDNESIFSVLASCIRDAKKNRQVILVTHNPNLAIGADAEQVIFVKLEKSKNYRFSYETGAIENPRINQKIVDVLEGTQPAFIKRRLKYQI